jgi:hypothetical protein
MKKYPVPTVTIIAMTILLAGCGAKEAKPKFSPAFTEYRTIQFITYRGYTPKSVMYQDNNGDILLACRDGATSGQLQEAGIPHTTSQLMLLSILGLLEGRDEYRTTFPILDGDQTSALRGIMADPARELAAAISPEVEELLEVVQREYPDHNSSFSIVFSYILDGAVWRVLEEEGLTAAPEITDDQTFWGGEVWSLYPPRAFSSGTNTFSGEGMVFAVNWSRGIMPKLRPFWADRSMLDRLCREYRSQGRVADPEVYAAYRPYNVIDEEGAFTIPIIVEREGNDLYDRCRGIAKDVALAVPDVLDLPGIREDFGFNNLSQATIIAYHELMWDTMEQLQEAGLITLPIAFTDPEQAELSDLADLILIRE